MSPLRVSEIFGSNNVAKCRTLPIFNPEAKK